MLWTSWAKRPFCNCDCKGNIYFQSAKINQIVFWNYFSFGTKRKHKRNNGINKQKNNPRIWADKHKITRNKQHQSRNKTNARKSFRPKIVFVHGENILYVRIYEQRRSNCKNIRSILKMSELRYRTGERKYSAECENNLLCCFLSHYFIRLR